MNSASVMANDVPVEQSVNLKPIYSAVESSDEDDHRWYDLREENAKMRQLARNKDLLCARCYGTLLKRIQSRIRRQIYRPNRQG